MSARSKQNRKCKVCPNTFTPWSSTQVVCSPDCARTKAEQDRIKKEAKEATRKRVETRKAKEAIKTRSDWMKEAQKAFNDYIRARDKDLPCISSGRTTGAWDAGHFRSVGSCPELRFCELNVHKQSVHDNQYLHGNLLEYRKRLIDRIGLEKVEWLEGPHDPKKYSISDLQEIKRIYKEKLKELQK